MSFIFRGSTSLGSNSFKDYYTKDETRKRFATQAELDNVKISKLSIDDNAGSNSQFTGKLKVIGEIEANTVTALQTAQTADALVAIGTGNDLVSGDLITGIYTKAKISSTTYWPGWIYNTANRLIHLLESTSDINSLTPLSTFQYGGFKCGDLNLASGRIYYPNSNSLCVPSSNGNQFTNTTTNDLVLNSINGSVHISGGGTVPGTTGSNPASLVVGSTNLNINNTSTSSRRLNFNDSTGTTISTIGQAYTGNDIFTGTSSGDLCIKGNGSNNIRIVNGVIAFTCNSAGNMTFSGGCTYNSPCTVSNNVSIKIGTNVTSNESARLDFATVAGIKVCGQNGGNLFTSSATGDLMLAAFSNSVRIGCSNTIATSTTGASGTVAAGIVVDTSNNTTLNGTLTCTSTTALNGDTTLTAGKVITTTVGAGAAKIGVNSSANGIFNGSAISDYCIGFRGVNGTLRLSTHTSNSSSIVLSTASNGSTTTATFSGITTTIFGGDINLPTSGGTASALNYYEENTSNTFTYSISGASSSATGIDFVRIGKIVSVLIKSVLLTTGGTTTAIITAGTTIPSRFFPKVDFSKMVCVRSGTTYSTGLLQVSSSTGTVTIQYTLDGTTNWPISTANSGLAFNENVTWNVA